MKFFIFFTILITISKAISDSLLTGTYDPNSTALVNERRDIKEIDVLRQIINQETLIRLAMVKDVKAIVDDVSFVKRSMTSIETTVSTLQQALETLKRQVATLNQNENLAQKIEKLKKQIDSLSQNDTLQQTLETLKREIDFQRRDKTLQNTVESLKREVNTQRQEDRKILENCQNRFQDFDQMFKILNENITYIYQYLNRTEVQTSEKGLKLKRDCKDYYLLGHTHSGVYEINPFGNETGVSVFCDMVTEGGGWTAIQKRGSGSVSFNKNWEEYRKGFGDPNGTYWIGNVVIHQLTKGKNSSLYVSITIKNGTTLYEHYQQFSVSDEYDKHRLYLGGPATGTLGDMMLNTGNYNADLSGMYFTTQDRDNDRDSGGNCAVSWGGGWWFNLCHNAYLTGPWNSSAWANPWYPKVTSGTSVTETMMMIKPH